MNAVDACDILRGCRHQVFWVEVVLTVLISKFKLTALEFL